MKPTPNRDEIRQAVLAAIHAGKTNAEIGAALSVSDTTIRRCVDGTERWQNMAAKTLARMAANLGNLDEPAVITPTTPAPEPTLPVARHTGMLNERMHEGRPVYTLQDVAEGLDVSLRTIERHWAELRQDEMRPGQDYTAIFVGGIERPAFYRQGVTLIAMNVGGDRAREIRKHVRDLDAAVAAGEIPAPAAPLSEVDKLALVLGVKLPELAAATLEAHAMARAAVITATEQAERLTQLEADMEARPMLRRRLHKAVGKLADEMAGVGMHSREVSKNARWLNDRIGQRWGVRDALTARQLGVALEWVHEQHERVNKRLPLIEVLTPEPGNGLADEVTP